MKRYFAYSIVVAMALFGGCGGGERDHYADAMEAARAGRNEKAIELFNLSLKERPGNARAHNYLGMMYMRTGDREASRREFEEAVAIDPSFGFAFYNLGTIYADKGMLDDALQKYTRAIDLAPDLVQAHNSFGVISTSLGRYEEAVQAFEAALSINPEFENARFNLGVVYATKMGEKEKAREHLRAYLKIAPGGDKADRTQKLLKELGEQSPAEFYNNGMELAATGHIEKALNQFEKALEIDPKYAPAILEAAGIYDTHTKDKEKAVRYYERYLEANLKADDAEEVMSLLAKARDELKTSLQEADGGVASIPMPSPSPAVAEDVIEEWTGHRDRALALQKSGDHSSAIMEFEKAAELNPGLDAAGYIARSYHELGIEYMEQGNFEGAMKAFRSSLSLVPSTGKTEYQLGRSCMSLGRHGEALEAFERASSHGVQRIGKDIAAVHAAMGEEHAGAGRPREALKCYERALERNPSNAELHARTARLLERGGNYKRALDEYREALDIDPNYAEAHSEAAALLEKEFNDKEKALAHYKRCLQLAPESPGARNAKAAVDRLSKAVDELKKYRKMVEKYPMRAEAHYNLAVVLQERGMLDEAIGEYKKTIRLKPDFDRAYFNLGAVYMKRGYYDRAIQMYQKATQLNPGYAKAHNNLGVLYSKRGRQAEALASYGRALSADPGFASAHFNAALLYKNLGKKEKALYHYKKYVEHAPRGKYTEEVKKILIKLGRQER
ncbi:MAG: tetratricopeptide repeat protein [Candidatus Tritonobacter lacicola]|nr:tetratricopeptide repeat protein [Candidatus Tritonobacter lacicola]